MEDLTENKPLFYSLCVSAVSLFILLMGWIPDISNQFQIVELPEQVTIYIAWECLERLESHGNV